jgi:hypothetical protein
MSTADNKNDIAQETQKNVFLQSRKKRNLAVALGLGIFIMLLYLVTIFKMGSALFI